MEYDHRSIPEKPISDTPESFQECLQLKAIIDEQVDFWAATILTRNTYLTRIGGIARLINSQCTIKDRPMDDLEVSPFESNLTPKEMEKQKQERLKLGVISELAQNQAFDEIPIEDTHLENYFAMVMRISQNPATPEIYQSAFRYVYRLYVADEHYAHITHKKITNESLGGFEVVIERMLNDIY